MAIKKQNNRHTTPPKNHIAFIMPRQKGIVSCHKSGTGNNQVRQQTTPSDNRWFNCKGSHSKSKELSSPVMSVPPPFNNSVINPPQLSLVCQQSSRSSQKTPRDNQCLNRKDRNSNINYLSLPVIPVPPPLNDSVIDPPQMSSVRQQSSSYSPNTTDDSQAPSIPGRTSPDTSSTKPPPSTKNGSRNIYGCMVNLSKLTLEERKQHAVMLLQHYHDLYNTNDKFSMFVSSPPISSIESLSQSTISSLYSGSFDRNWADVNIQQQTTLEVADTDIVMADNEELDTTPPQDISNVFAGLYLHLLFPALWPSVLLRCKRTD